MQVILNFFGGLLAFGWAAVTVDYVAGAKHGRTLTEEPPFPVTASGDTAGEGIPSLSIVVAACNEEEKLPAAFRTLLKQEYPGSLEIVAVNDRSTDATPMLLESLAQEGRSANSKESPGPGKPVVVLHIAELPQGWLGKNHALYQGARAARGEYLLFTDADVHFAPDVLSRAVHLAEREHADHVVAFLELDLRGFWEHVFGLCFSYLFFLRFKPWHVGNPNRDEYLGIGAFNLVRRDAYEAIGTHRRLALEVADDMELGRLMKQGKLKTVVVGAKGLIRVRWQEGFSGLLNGLMKNAYAGLDYDPRVVIASSGLLLLTVLGPVLGLLLAKDPRTKAAYAFCTACYVGMGAYQAKVSNIPPAYALTLPLSPVLLIYVMFRSMYLTEKNGGITWRGTFYPLPLLRERPLPAW